MESSPGITDDSIGVNDFTNNGCAVDAANYKEGAGSCQMVSSESDYMSIADASLSSGFPFKSGTTDRTMAFAFWFKPASVSVSSLQALISKYSENSKRTFMIAQYSNTIRIYQGNSNGASYNSLSNTFYISAGRWYHIAGYFCGVDKEFYIRIWDDTAQAIVYDHTYAILDNSFNLAAPFAVGCYFNSSDVATGFGNGLIDELLIGFGKLAPHEIDQIRAGTFDGTADGLAFYELDGEVEFKPTAKVWVTQVLAEVLYAPQDPNQRTYDGDIDLTITPSSTSSHHFSYNGNVAVAINATAENYYYQSASEKVYVSPGIPIAVTPSSTRIRSWATTGNVPVAITPQATYSNLVRTYVGDITVNITPTGGYRMPVPGWDSASGYGEVDITDLSASPPYWVITGDEITFEVSDDSVYSPYAETSLEMSNGIELGGELTFDIFDPTVEFFSLAGGIALSGHLETESVVPPVLSHELRLGLVLGGKLGFSYVDEADIPITTITLKKGVKFGGALEFVFVGADDLITLITLDGGIKFGDIRRVPFTFVTPVSDETLTDIEFRGTLYLSGTLGFETTEPGVYQYELSRGLVKFGGAIVFGFWEPVVVTLELDGGIFLEGEAITEEALLYETWALNGFYFEPSIYGNFPFNSYGKRGGQYYAAGSDGIYLLEGEDDAGNPIHPGVRIGPANFGVNNRKRLRAVYPGKAGMPDMRLVGAEGQDSFCTVDDRGRFSVSQKVQSEVMTIEISDFERLAQVEFVPVILTKR